MTDSGMNTGVAGMLLVPPKLGFVNSGLGPLPKQTLDSMVAQQRLGPNGGPTKWQFDLQCRIENCR
jgi:hypothetical protein